MTWVPHGHPLSLDDPTPELPDTRFHLMEKSGWWAPCGPFNGTNIPFQMSLLQSFQEQTFWVVCSQRVRLQLGFNHLQKYRCRVELWGRKKETIYYYFQNYQHKL